MKNINTIYSNSGSVKKDLEISFFHRSSKDANFLTYVTSVIYTFNECKLKSFNNYFMLIWIR